jgi:hypothetical protein
MPLGKFLKVLFGGLAALAILFVVGVEFSLIQSNGDIGNYTAYEQATKETYNSVFSLGKCIVRWVGDRSHDFWLALLTGVIALFIGLLWWSTRKLWRAGEKQLRITQRSHLAIEPSGVFPLVAPQTVGRISIRNVGGVPARNVRWFMHQEVTSNLQVKVFPIQENDMGQRNVVPPGIAMDFGQSWPITSSQIAEIKRGSAYYVWGIVRYTDVFGGDRFTRFCHRYGSDNVIRMLGGDNREKDGLSREGAKYHQWGNDAEEEK